MKLAHSKGYPTYMRWPKPWATSYFGFIFKYFLCPHGQSTLELLFGRNHQSFWENMFKVKLKNGSNFIYFVRTKSLFELFFILFFPTQDYLFLTAKFRLLRHCFPVFFRVSRLSGSWNILFQQLKRKFLDDKIL